MLQCTGDKTNLLFMMFIVTTLSKTKIKNKRPINQAFPFTVIRNVGTNDC